MHELKALAPKLDGSAQKALPAIPRVFVYLALALSLASSACGVMDAYHRSEEFKAKNSQATRMWKERCQTRAGEKIYRTAHNVEGIFLLKLRTKFGDDRGQYAMDDQYGRDSFGEEYIKSFLKGYHRQYNPEDESERLGRVGYRYVEAIDPKDRVRYRYTASMKVIGQMKLDAPAVLAALKDDPHYDTRIWAFVLDRVPADGPLPRYGITYDDISTQDERDHWIAGSSLRVIDMETQEVVAERIGYMMDWAQGSQARARSPWLFAADLACPDFPLRERSRHGFSVQTGQTLVFAEKVLHPAR